MCLHVFLFVFPQGPFQLSVFFGAFTYFRPVAPSSKALCSSHDFAERVETSTDGCGNAGCTQQTLGGEMGLVWENGVFFQKEARGCWCSVKSTRRCFEWMIYWLMLLLKKTTSVVDNIWWKNLRLKWEISPCWHQLHQFLSSVKPNDGTEINIHTVFLAETQEVLADAMSGGGMAGVFCRLEIARSKGRVALWFFFSKQELYF